MEALLDGTRQPAAAENEAVLRKASGYAEAAQARVLRNLHGIFWAALAAAVFYLVVEDLGLSSNGWDFAKGFALGLVIGALLVGLFLTGRRFAGVRDAKRRLLRRLRKKS